MEREKWLAEKQWSGHKIRKCVINMQVPFDMPAEYVSKVGLVQKIAKAECSN